MKRDLIPHPLSGTVLARATAGIASAALAVTLTSCAFSFGELEPVGEERPTSASPAAAEETAAAEQPAEGGAEEVPAAEGVWNELPVDPSGALAWDDETYWLSGSGDALYRLDWTPTATTTLELTHSGSANFIVVPYDADGARLGSLANEIGAYEGNSVLEEAAILGSAAEVEFIHIQADGAWTIGR
ncbi:hypothetical protein ACIBFB_13530 [Nocardiopsis sp. NPDC050513]|uniref:hypothetical protein n=1 Tax=Nocardiopsis sp. NPDC050513 TaxID=3364338 RepID=UPI003792981F